MFMEALSGTVLCDVSPRTRRLLCFWKQTSVKDHQVTQIFVGLRQCGGCKGPFSHCGDAEEVALRQESVLRVSFGGAALWDLLQT